jgi:hypothetical protein
MPLGSFFKRALTRRRSKGGHEGDSLCQELGAETKNGLNDPINVQGTNIARRKSSDSLRHEPNLAEENSSKAQAEEQVVGRGEPGDDSVLTRDDLKILFSGAPHFMLEKGRRRRLYPQAFYPWDDDLSIGDLQDRQWLKHETFALATLHAHLPVPDSLDFHPSSLGPLKQEDSWKRPAFEVGVFEVPNMLAYQGKESGTVGLRYFLELPVADWLREEDGCHEEAGAAETTLGHHVLRRCSEGKHCQEHEAIDTIGKHAPKQDLCQVIHGDADDWRRLGVRDIAMQTVIDRLAAIGTWHEEVVSEGWLVTALDKQDAESLYRTLFTQFLYPPEMVSSEDEPKGLKMQIEALVKVLTTPRAWYDLSVTKWRLRAGQTLWELPRYPGNQTLAEEERTLSGQERRWLLIQLLLAIELVVRLDAAMRVGLARHSPDLHISAHEIHHFNKLRNRKVDWDLIFARRFLDNLQVRYLEFDTQTAGLVQNGHLAFDEESDPFGFRCEILPRQPQLLIDGLIRFAQAIEWPDVERIESVLKAKLERAQETPGELYKLYSSPLQAKSKRNATRVDENCSMRMDASARDGQFAPFMYLQTATKDSLGSWLSRSWLSGLVLPGHTAPHLLMSTLLENDVAALDIIEQKAFLCGGFVLRDRTWWSKVCIVGQVLGALPSSTDCMGWVNVPGVLPVSATSKKKFGSGWFHIHTDQVPGLREQTRIHDGANVAHDSSPLGSGQGGISSKEYRIPRESALQESQGFDVELEALILDGKHRAKGSSDPVMHAQMVFVAISATPEHSHIILDLHHDVQFVSSQPCRLPHVHTRLAKDKIEGDLHRRRGGNDNGHHLPSHPLHNSFRYVRKELEELHPSVTPPNHTDLKSDVWIIDARVGSDTQTFARAWCAHVGRHALVAKVSRTCLSCCVREARAIDVGIVIRIG